MLQHFQTVQKDTTMKEAEDILLNSELGYLPVVEGEEAGKLGGKLVGLITRTDVLRQHQFYSNLHYHNKAFSDKISSRKNIIELRKKLKKFDDLEDD